MRIALTPGEPAGIGPDLCIQLAQSPLDVELVVYADPDLLAQRAKQLDLPVNIKLYQQDNLNEIDSADNERGEIKVVPVTVQQPASAGKLNPHNAAYVLQTLDLAVQACQQQGVDALVTGPVQKSVINQAGINFTGHTEYLAEHTQASLPVMMLQTDQLRVALATTHLPLAQVANTITQTLLTEVISIIDRDLRQQFAIDNPCIMICGLNPHAGEGGHLGSEEIETIIPVINKLRRQGLNLIGPLSADTIFSKQNLATADVFLAMYHDQGLPVLKTLGFGEAVNVTLGLPIIRTSVDHGTALELAGTGKANPQSLDYAIKIAADIVRSKQETTETN